jgi:hypothetical protein
MSSNEHDDPGDGGDFRVRADGNLRIDRSSQNEEGAAGQVGPKGKEIDCRLLLHSIA